MPDKDYFRVMREDGKLRVAYNVLERQRTDLINQQAALKRQNKTVAAEKLQADINRISEQIGMQRSEQAVLSRFPDQKVNFIYGEPGVPGKPGDFDLVAHIEGKDGQPDRYIVVESKGGSSPLGSRMVDGFDNQGRPKELRAEQGSREYFDKIQELMRNNSDPDMRRVGTELTRAVDAENVEYWHVTTPINGGKTGQTSVQYFDMQYEP
jgi:hypothetical protein